MRWQKGSRWDTPRFDVHNPRVHSFGGDYPRTRDNFWTGNHPRGTRWAYLDYDLPGLEVHVHVDGKANDLSVDRGGLLEDRDPVVGAHRPEQWPLAATQGRRHVGHLHGPLSADCDTRPGGCRNRRLGGASVRRGGYARAGMFHAGDVQRS